MKSEYITQRNLCDEGHRPQDGELVSEIWQGCDGSSKGDDRGRKRKFDVLFKSQTVEWATPEYLYDKLNKEFSFNFDPCPLGGEDDGLATLFCSWKNKRVFCNPPYGPGIADWLKRGFDAEIAVYLLPARTDTKWFHEIVLPKASEIRFIKGRLKFGESKNSAPFPSMVVIITACKP